MADDENTVEEKIVINYDQLDEQTGFKKAELDIWNRYEKDVLLKPADDRPEVDSWVDEFSEESKFDKRRVKFVTSVGIYAGSRDEFNQRSGSGKAIYANGDVYDGDFFEGKKHGTGQYIFKKLGKSEVDKIVEKLWIAKPATESTDAFTLRCAKEVQIGRSIVEGILEQGFYPVYHGEYVRGQRVGQGVMKNKDASVYKGDWKDNKRHGQGIFYYLNGDVYSGQWAEGVKHGFGTYRFADGSEYRGEWNKGTMVSGQWVMADGSYYEGKFDAKNRPCDEQGQIHFPRKGIRMVGVFQRNKWAPLAEMVLSEETPATVEDAPWSA